jgi:uncharacterized membrane protein YczE
MKDKRLKRIVMCIFGVLLCSLSVGFFKRATFGVDPFQSFMAGLDEVVPISFGTLYVIANACLLVFGLVADRHYVGLGTLINVFLAGYIVDFSKNLMFELFPEIGIPLRVFFLLIGIVIMCFAAAVYFTADMGVSPYDAVALIITNTWNIGKFKWNRVICDLVCVAVGVALYLLSGAELSGLASVVGLGTIITAFFMGPLIDFFKVHAAEPFLNR